MVLDPAGRRGGGAARRGAPGRHRAGEPDRGASVGPEAPIATVGLAIVFPVLGAARVAEPVTRAVVGGVVLAVIGWTLPLTTLAFVLILFALGVVASAVRAVAIVTACVVVHARRTARPGGRMAHPCPPVTVSRPAAHR